MTRKSRQFRKRYKVEPDVVGNWPLPEFPGSSGTVPNAFACNDNIHFMRCAGHVFNQVGSVLLHAAQHKRIDAVCYEKNLQSGCKLVQIAGNHVRN